MGGLPESFSSIAADLPPCVCRPAFEKRVVRATIEFAFGPAEERDLVYLLLPTSSLDAISLCFERIPSLNPCSSRYLIVYSDVMEPVPFLLYSLSLALGQTIVRFRTSVYSPLAHSTQRRA